jgi:hypothetical protein
MDGHWIMESRGAVTLSIGFLYGVVFHNPFNRIGADFDYWISKKNGLM